MDMSTNVLDAIIQLRRAVVRMAALTVGPGTTSLGPLGRQEDQPARTTDGAKSVVFN